jgi:hypothetical protein
MAAAFSVALGKTFERSSTALIPPAFWHCGYVKIVTCAKEGERRICGMLRPPSASMSFSLSS